MKNKKLLFILAAVAILAAVLIIVTQFQKPKESTENVIKIGAILPLTGTSSLIGEWVKNGIDLAVEEINITGGVDGKKLEIIYGDSKNDPKEGIAVFNHMFSLYKMPVVISAMTGVTNAIIPIADKNKVVLFATAASASGLTDQSEWVFRLFITADIDAKTMAEFAINKLKIKTAGILHVNDDMGISFSKIFKTTFENGKGKILFIEGFDRGTTDFRNIIYKIKAYDAEAIYILGYDNNLGVLPKQIRENGIKSRFLSIGTIAQQNVILQAGDSLEGAYFTTTEFSSELPKTEIAKNFSIRYKAKYGSDANYFAAFAYDSVSLIVNSIKRGGYESDKIRNSILEINNFPGVIGKITIKYNGDADFPMVVKTIKKGKVEDVE